MRRAGQYGSGLIGLFVGLYYLIRYFSHGTDGDWGLYLALPFTAVGVLAIVSAAHSNARSRARRAALEQNGAWALAQITGLAEAGTRINDRPVVKVNLHIAGPGFAFDTQIREIIDIAKQANLTARKLVVLMDPTTQDCQIDWERSSMVNGLAPAQFTIAEDNKTYDLAGQAGPLIAIWQILKTNRIQLKQMVDLPSDPAVRQHVVAVIRRAGAEQLRPGPAPAAPAPAMARPAFTAPQPSVAQRLQDLETLRATRSISDAEYTRKREQIISAI